MSQYKNNYVFKSIFDRERKKKQSELFFSFLCQNTHSTWPFVRWIYQQFSKHKNEIEITKQKDAKNVKIIEPHNV